MKNWYIKTWIFILLGVAVVACSNMNDLHDKYLQEGETIYLAKFDSVKLYPGRYRVRIDYWMTDPKAKKCVVEWNMGAESRTLDITNTTGETPHSFYIEELDETTISFDFTTYTEDMEYPSLKTHATTTIYGDRYVSTLLNTNVSSYDYSLATQSLTLYWNSNYEGVAAYLIRYTDVNGDEQEIRVDVNTEKKAILPHFPEFGSFTYASVYLPVEGAIDEFTTPYSEPFSTAKEGDEPWKLTGTLTLSAETASSLKGWQAVDTYMKKYDFEYTEHPNNGNGKDHNDDTHIEVVEDNALGQWVFKFNVHASADADGNIAVLDGDRGSLNDRMRNEMKSRTGDGRYHMNGNWEEWQRLEWKFKIPKGFRPTKSFTHIHQLKAQEGNNGSPLITITPRASDTNGKNSRIQVIHTGDNSGSSKGTIIDNLPLSDFEDEWIQVTTEMFYSHAGSFYIRMERISDGKVLVEKQFTDIDLWRKGATNIRNKFGIYRSYGGKLEADFKGKFPTSGIKDESLYLADFKIYEKKTNPDPQPHD